MFQQYIFEFVHDISSDLTLEGFLLDISSITANFGGASPVAAETAVLLSSSNLARFDRPARDTTTNQY